MLNAPKVLISMGALFGGGDEGELEPEHACNPNTQSDKTTKINEYDTDSPRKKSNRQYNSCDRASQFYLEKRIKLNKNRELFFRVSKVLTGKIFIFTERKY